MKPDGLPSFPFIQCICDLTLGLHQLDSFLMVAGVLLAWGFCEGMLHTGKVKLEVFAHQLAFTSHPGLSIRKRGHAHPI